MATIEHNPNEITIVGTDRWSPILDGDVFCSPACGAKCKLADYQHAVEAANLLANTLGSGWEPHIWENCGWYYEASKGDVTVGRDGKSFTAAIEVDYISENHVLSIRQSSSNPRQAVEDLVLRLSAIITRLSRAKASATLELMSLEQ